MISIATALIAAVAYGVSDFLGAVATTKLRVIPTTTISYAAATVALGVAILVSGGVWSAEVLFWGGVAGVSAVIGFVTFYAAMSRGPMSLASPLIAVLTAAVPVVAAVLLGEVLSALAWVGIVLALASAVLISSQPRGGGGRLAVPTGILAVISGLGLGGSIIALDRAPHESGLIAAFLEIVVGLVLLGMALVLTVVSKPAKRVLDGLGVEVNDTLALDRRRATWGAIAAGVLLGISNGLLLVALQAGSLAVVSVLVALYPLATLLLARVVTKERVSRVQLGGVGLAIVASAVLGFALGGSA